MGNQRKHIITAIICSTILVAIFVAGYLLVPNASIKRFCEVFGGHMPAGVIQYVTYISFFWGMFEIKDRLQHAKEQSKSLKMNLLPEQEQWVMNPNDVNDLKIKMIDLENQTAYKHYQLISVIKKACTKFRSTRSVSEVLEVVKNQIKLYLNRSESSQATIRYLAWMLPSLGFLGTVIGIAQSLGLAGGENNTEEVVNAMEVAFDTTLVSLLLLIPIMWYYHHLQETEETLYINMEEYVMENLVNRINLE